MTSYIVDSSVWISYFEGSNACKAFIDENKLQTPTIVVAEVAKILARKGFSEAASASALNFIFVHSLILPLGFEQAVEGGKTVDREKLGFVDAIVYSYASEENELLTRDKEFQGKSFVRLVEG